jgi:hypothetical protein
MLKHIMQALWQRQHRRRLDPAGRVADLMRAEFYRRERQRVYRLVRAEFYARGWREADHPRDEAGRFSEGQAKREKAIQWHVKQNHGRKAVEKAAKALGLAGDEAQAFVEEVQAQQAAGRKQQKQTATAANERWEEYRGKHPKYTFQLEGVANPYPIMERLSTAAERIAAAEGWEEEAHTADSAYFRHAQSGARFRVSNHPPTHYRSAADGGIDPSGANTWLRVEDWPAYVDQQLAQALASAHRS